MKEGSNPGSANIFISLLVSLWTVLRLNPSSTKQWIFTNAVSRDVQSQVLQKTLVNFFQFRKSIRYLNGKGYPLEEAEEDMAEDDLGSGDASLKTQRHSSSHSDSVKVRPH